MQHPIPDFITPKTTAEARAMQQALKGRVVLENSFREVNTIAGIDVGIDKIGNRAHASIVVLEAATLAVIEQVQAFAPADFPYVPGLLSFREIPAILHALKRLKTTPDMLMVDGQGIAHPRRLGIAAHLGVLLDMATIGVAKSKLFGTHAAPTTCGEAVPLMDKSEQLGWVLMSKKNCKPLFISPGHKVDLQTALNLTRQCLITYRLPEPTRLADKFSKKEYMQ